MAATQTPISFQTKRNLGEHLLQAPHLVFEETVAHSNLSDLNNGDKNN